MQSSLLHSIMPSVANMEYLGSSLFNNINFSDTGSIKYLESRFYDLVATDPVLDHVRLLDFDGNELIRVNRNISTIEIIEKERLQNKQSRLYFQKAMQLHNAGDVYISPLQLNMEYGKIQIPYNPLIRTVSPIMVGEKDRGFFVANLSLNEILNDPSFIPEKVSGGWNAIFGKSGDGVMLTADTKFYLFEGCEKSYMFDSIKKIPSFFDENSNGVFSTDNGVYVLREININKELKKRLQNLSFQSLEGEDSELFILAYIPFVTTRIWYNLSPFNYAVLGILFFLFLGVSILLVKRQLFKETAFRQINHLNDELIKSQSQINRDRNELFNSVQRLKVKNGQLFEFSRIVSHNLRAPISSLLLATDYLSAEWSKMDDIERNILITELKNSTSGLLDLIEDLLKTVAVLNDSSPQIEVLHIEESFERVKSLFKSEIERRGAKINLVMEDWDHIEYNRSYLESILMNLLSNSLKYSDPARKPEILIECKLSGERKVLIFSDNGRGMNLKWHKENIFGMHKTFHRDVKGKGFGLFMTKNQIESMGGQIYVESDEGKGTTFTIEFN